MYLIIGVSFVILLLINAMSIKSLSKYKELLEQKNSEIIELNRLKSNLANEAEKSKSMYSSERKSLIDRNNSYKVTIETLDNRLQEFTREKLAYYSQMDNLDNSAKEMSPEEFFKLRDKAIDKKSKLHDFTGIYVLENKTHDKFYVGQSISLYRRVGNHFSGTGNKDIYEDFLNGDKWTIRLISLANSGFNSINALEKHFIGYHSSTHNGYNKTIGNAN